METNDKLIKNKRRNLTYIKVIIALIILLLIIISIVTYSSYQAKQLNKLTTNITQSSKYNNQALHIQEQNNIALATYFRDEYIIAGNLSPLLKILNTYSTNSLPSANDIYNIEATTKSVLNSNELAEMSNLYNNNNYIQQQLINYRTPAQIKNFLNTKLSAAEALASIENIQN